MRREGTAAHVCRCAGRTAGRLGNCEAVQSVVERLARLAELAARYADRNPDLAGLCLIRLSELYPKHPFITTDLADFRVYRRGRRELIPLICPPA